LLESATTVEFIDWPHQDVPGTLIRAGYSVVGHEPDGYRTYVIDDKEPAGRVFPLTGGGYLVSHLRDTLPERVDIVNTFRPAEEQAGRVFPLTGGGYLVSHLRDTLPERVDIVNTFRPAEEQADIARGAIEIGAKALWIQPGETVSTEARDIAERAGLVYVDGIDIAEAVRALGISKSPLETK